ncbi:Phosphofructokinase [Clostridiales bacterium oral taxon 876 str. F0540]|nr:Phosphofructokinase [Clostridiales bacterium oral taxon 876 str. F0540]
MKLEGKVVVAQGGGPTAVINQSLVGAVLESRKFMQVTKVYGAVNGVTGIINEDFFDLTQETTHNLEQVAITPSSALFSTRDKPDEKYCKEIFSVLKAHDVRYFFYIGGNDSADTVRIVNEQAKKSDYEFRAIHIPKTIDNDLIVNDHTPGYGSAARFIANAFVGANLDNRALPGVYIGVVMGRDAGFLTAASSIAQKYPDDGPHLIYLPERPFDMEKYLRDVKKVYDKYGRCVIAVSEGIKDKNGVPIITKLVDDVEKDAHGNIQLSGTGALGDLLANYIKKNLNIKRVRSDTFGYLQRSFMGCVSDVDQHEAREVGEKAAQFAIWHNIDGSITIHRTGYYSVDYKITPLEEVAGKTKHMSDEFINYEGNNVTDAFKFYVRPLLGSGLESAHRIRAPRVSKILRKDE